MPIAFPALPNCSAAARFARSRACAAALACFLPVAASAFGFDDVAARAAADARVVYVPPPPVPAELLALKYDAYRDIRYQPARALWRQDGLAFEAQFFHPGGPAKAQPVRISEIDAAGGVRPIQLDPLDYHYGRNAFSSTGAPVGHAGFRIHYPLNTTAYKDELVTFLGASYFRAVGKGQHYGLSARGLAVDTVGGGAEEFPVFKAFWIERPAADAQTLTVYAQLDSQRVTGAYQFTLRPGDETVVDVRARLYLRDTATTGLPPVATLGIAPLTSMFQHGENAPRAGEFRPEVHDSDGLMVATGNGEWLWRPLINPNRVRTSSFLVDELKGFGLMQRDRAFTDYEDIEARYERRPSAWIVPRSGFGAGRVELVELPTPDETHDNIVAYWVPARLPAAGQPIDLAYAIHWQAAKEQLPPNGWTLQSRLGRGYSNDAPLRGEFQYVVDFAGPAFAALPADAVVEANVTVGANGRLLERNAYRNEMTGGWRMAIRIQRFDTTQPLELRAYLQQATHALTETWTTLIQPD